MRASLPAFFTIALLASATAASAQANSIIRSFHPEKFEKTDKDAAKPKDEAKPDAGAKADGATPPAADTRTDEKK